METSKRGQPAVGGPSAVRRRPRRTRRSSARVAWSRAIAETGKHRPAQLRTIASGSSTTLTTGTVWGATVANRSARLVHSTTTRNAATPGKVGPPQAAGQRLIPWLFHLAWAHLAVKRMARTTTCVAPQARHASRVLSCSTAALLWPGAYRTDKAETDCACSVCTASECCVDPCTDAAKATCSDANKESCSPGTTACGSCKSLFRKSGDSCVDAPGVASALLPAPTLCPGPR